MSKFNFKSAICTSREQSKRLLALGLRKETADMTHHYLHSTDGYELKDIEFSRVMHLQELVNKKPVLGKSGDDLYAKDIPAWGLHRLIEILDTNPFVFYLNCGYNTVIDQVEEYIRSGFIDTRYLEEWCLNEEE